MKSIVNFFKGIIIGAWIIVAIFSTICLISFNEFRVSEFGDYSLFIIDNNELEPTFAKNDVVIIKKQSENSYKSGDLVFFYLGNTETQSYINLGKISSIDKYDRTLDTFHFDNDTKVTSDFVIGEANGAIIWHKIGLLLNIFESRWGFLFLIILPTLFAIVYEIYYIAVEVKKEARREAKREATRK